MNMLKESFEYEEGQGMTEYALIISTVAIALTLILIAFGTNLLGMYTDITLKLP